MQCAAGGGGKDGGATQDEVDSVGHLDYVRRKKTCVWPKKPARLHTDKETRNISGQPAGVSKGDMQIQNKCRPRPSAFSAPLSLCAILRTQNRFFWILLWFMPREESEKKSVPSGSGVLYCVVVERVGRDDVTRKSVAADEAEHHSFVRSLRPTKSPC